MDRASLERAIPASSLIAVDSSVVLAYLDGTEETSWAAAVVFDELVARGRNPAVLSAITVTEALVRPFRAGSRSALGTVETFLRHFPNLTVAPVTFEIAREGARIRAATSLRAPDALVLATAEVSGAQVIVANDDRWAGAARRAGLTPRLLQLS